ncbi:DUF3788 domain-containing protein [Clostridium formicaceticum]|uniref:DUF3788 domain-containing protein n=1 Tax=Clostridium formicaceticum TaxID=1497 RepID=A0AAC9WG86_9CLOT|nr:DUF3788 domain-containing protein [Clostridium formicaceticum]AOY76109.1 hypothetical protein BJL90_09470 [Clostridium formicaceticum]ARE86475.1 hypothetical protein CLFO_07970 [Clostridium formicaceticum]
MTKDLILDGLHTPTYDEISAYMNKSARLLWQDMNSFIQLNYKSSPRISYSKCSGKPGWNIKYKKLGKSLCTLYPEKEGFVALVVITLELLPVIEAMTKEFEPDVLGVIKAAKPFNGTLWLMIQVDKASILEDVKRLLFLKHQPKNPQKYL